MVVFLGGGGGLFCCINWGNHRQFRRILDGVPKMTTPSGPREILQTVNTPCDALCPPARWPNYKFVMLTTETGGGHDWQDLLTYICEPATFRPSIKTPEAPSLATGSGRNGSPQFAVRGVFEKNGRVARLTERNFGGFTGRLRVTRQSLDPACQRKRRPGGKVALLRPRH